jgi:phosphate transport system permease protein
MAVGTLSSGNGVTRDTPFVISRSRRVKNRFWWGLCLLMILLLVTPVVWILAGTIGRAAPGWKWNILWETTSGLGGGLSGAIVGTLLLMVCIGIVASIIGIGSGVYLSEFAGPRRYATVLRSSTEILSGMPSIVFGYCAYLTLVIGLHWGEGLLPAVIAVALLVVPYIAKSTELALGQVPLTYREGAEALGMTKSNLLRRVVMRSALPGILTGIIVALAISVGETAPLLYTAGYSTAYPTGAILHSQLGYLPGAVYTDYSSAVPAFQQLSKDGSVLLIVLVLILILMTRVIVRLTQKFSPNRAASGTSRRERRAAGATPVGASPASGPLSSTS